MNVTTGRISVRRKIDANSMGMRRRNTVWFAVVVVVGLSAAASVRALLLRSVQVAPARQASVTVDATAAAGRLGALVRAPTVSWGETARRDPVAFDRLSTILTESFPNVHRVLSREAIARWSLLYTWRGSRPDLPPIVLTSHLDVVPVEPGTESRWTHPPFEGVVADGSVWGRGTIDDKSGVGGLLEAAEALIAAGFVPARTIYFAFGHNEEGGGDPSGAAQLAATLAGRGVHDAWLLDEGGLIYDQLLGVRQPVAFVGIAEKEVAALELVAHSAGGHAAMPPTPTAVGLLAEAIDRLERHPMPARLDGPTRQMFDTLAPEMSFGMKLAFANLWLTRPIMLRVASARAQTNALIRTTEAPTMISASPKINVLAAEARAFVNVRLLPGDTPEMVERHTRDVVGDDRVDVRLVGSSGTPSRASATNTPEFAALEASIRAVYPHALVAPYLTIAATDAREYAAVAPNTYRFLPIYQHGALEMIHGTDEHVTIEAYERAIRVYATLIEQLAR